MLKYTWIVIYGIFYTAAATITFGKLNGKDKSVNLALETVFEFGDEDKKGDVNILNSVQKFIGKVKNVIENNNGGRRHLLDDNKRFTSFIVDVMKILKQYDDQDLEQLANIVGDEMKYHHRKGSQLHDLTKSLGVQEIVENKLVELKKKPAEDIRDYLDSIASKIDKEKYMETEKRFLDAINSLYAADSAIKLNKFLTDLDEYRLKARKNMDLTKIISHGLKSIFFDHYINLNSNLRSTFLSDLDSIFSQLFSRFDKITVKDIGHYSEPVTETMNLLRTSRQMYVEKDLDTNYIENAFHKWISEKTNKEEKSKDKKTKKHTGISHGKHKHKTRWTYTKLTDKTRTLVTRHRHNVPTTRKSEFNIDALRSRNKKHRLVKVNKEESTHRYKKRKTETTKEFRTLRQMYVEKNIDLKYDPDAYENLTTPNKVRTTRKHVKNTYKDDEDSNENHSDTGHSDIGHSDKGHSDIGHSDIGHSDTGHSDVVNLDKEEAMRKQYVKKHDIDDDSEDSGQNPNKAEKTMENIFSDFMIELSTEVHAPSITKKPKTKVTKQQRQFGQTLIGEDLDYAESPVFRNHRKEFTYSPSSPKFLIDWPTKTPGIIKEIYSPSALEVTERQLNRGSIEDREAHMHKPSSSGVTKDSKKDKDLDYSIEVKKDKYLERSRINKQSYRNKVKHYSKVYPRKNRVHIRNIGKRYHGNIPVLRQESDSLSGKIKMSRSPLILAKHYRGSHRLGKDKFRRAYSQAPKSEEGLTIEADDDKNIKTYYKGHDNLNTDSNKQVLKRLQKLEDELENVKTQIRNDTNSMKDLIKNSRNVKTNENQNEFLLQKNSRKVKQLQNVIAGLNSKPILDIEAATQLKSINGGGFNMDIPDMYKPNNYDMNKKTFDVAKDRQFTEIKHNSYRGPYENPSKIDNTIVKQDYAENVNKEAQGRKAFPDLKNIEVKPDEHKVNDNLSNFDSLKNNIETLSVTSKIKEITSDSNQNHNVSLKDRQDKALYFRANDQDSDESTFNETAYETLKDKYGFSANQINSDVNQNQNDTKVLNSETTVILEEEQLNNDIQMKAATTKADLDNPVALITQSNNFKDVKHNERVDFIRNSFKKTTNDNLDKDKTTKVDLTTKVDASIKINDEIIAKSDNIVTPTSINNLTTVIVPEISTVQGHLINELIKEIGGHLAALPGPNAGNIEMRSVDKDANILANTIKIYGIKNDTLPGEQNLLDSNIQRPMNVSLTF